MVSHGLKHMEPCAGCWGERNNSCVKMFTVLLWRRTNYYYTMQVVPIGWVHRLTREGPLTEPNASKELPGHRNL